ncbi:MAG: stage III sporulation protein AF [Clostridiaceae bacterium]|nr:stage III sporulation protein AF [Clostridiaceae bacterium]
MEVIRNWIINIITIVIVSFFAEMIIPGGSFKKYAKLVIGIVVMIALVKPVIQLSNSEQLLSKMTVEVSNYVDRTRIAERSRLLEEKQNSQIVNIYHEQLTRDIERRVNAISQTYYSQVEVNIDRDIKSSGFGSIRSINITLIPRQEEGGDNIPVVKPVKITVGSEKSGFISERAQQEMPYVKDVLTKEEEELKLKLIDQLQAIYNIPGDNIKINIKKKE